MRSSIEKTSFEKTVSIFKEVRDPLDLHIAG